jgi:hypothetical protein
MNEKVDEEAVDVDRVYVQFLSFPILYAYYMKIRRT